MSLGLALQNNLAVEIGMSDDSVAWLSLWSQRGQRGMHGHRRHAVRPYGRRRTLFVYLALMSLPVLYMMAQLTGTSGSCRWPRPTRPRALRPWR
jgi:PAT family beta-lactamase induction signal transducer AmpG